MTDISALVGSGGISGEYHSLQEGRVSPSLAAVWDWVFSDNLLVTIVNREN